MWPSTKHFHSCFCHLVLRAALPDRRFFTSFTVAGFEVKVTDEKEEI